jgi:hypothetical protein
MRESSPSGLLFAFLSGLFFVGNGLIVSSSNLPAAELIFGRCVIQIIIALPIITYRHYKGK